MRIEIMVENDDYQIFPLNKPKILIGSGDNCDIVVAANGVSRKHLTLISENDRYFVIDQGSTNGSFINEERLIPGRQVEFTSFFPLRLGDNVLITLLSDEENEDFSGLSEYNVPKEEVVPNEATRAISLKDLQSANTETLVKKRQETVIRKKAQAKAPPKKNISDKSRMRLVVVVSVIFVTGAFALSYLSKEEEVVKAPPVYKVKKVVPKAVDSRFKLVKKEDLPAFESLAQIQTNTPCLTDFEKTLCESLAANNVKVVQVGTMLHIFMDGNEFYNKAKEAFKAPEAKEGETVPDSIINAYRSDLVYSSFILFVSESFPKDFNLDPFKGLNFTFIFEVNTTENEKTSALVSIVPESMKELITVIEPRHLETAKRYGMDSLHFLKQYFTYSTQKQSTAPDPTENSSEDPVTESSETQSAPASEP